MSLSKTFYSIAIVLSLSGCAAALVPATSDPNKKLAQAYDLLSVYRPKPARQLIDESIEIFKERGDKEKLAYAYMVSTDYYRYVASEAYRQFDPSKPTWFVKPIPWQSVYGVRTERVWTAHKLAEDAYKQIIEEAIAAKDHLKASMNYQFLYLLYARNAQKPEACSALDGELEQYKLAKAAKPDLQIFYDTSKYNSPTEVVEDIRKKLKCNEL